MRDQLKVIIGFGCIWGVFVLAGILLSSFTWGSNDTAPELFALVLYALTTLPSFILAIWHRRVSGIWLIALSVITLVGFIYQLAGQAVRSKGTNVSFSVIAWMILFAAIPAFFGVALLRTTPLDEVENNLG